ncbi:hypothetical protein SAMN05421780_10456 [Flexibacter flexilis DSM 6793]|uniref:Uncharacterized protein n=1 Tax=Flexibacter flexilis DSM 6793 TaxID=927664 RepID=A0A1I1HQU8_9BACT|nr:hypothetical protein [Flexibacter flexilis]SFC26236.1 hypothetical protein SAMN05421780_10456 [Flexibacter flexilis DSM 6793]
MNLRKWFLVAWLLSCLVPAAVAQTDSTSAEESLWDIVKMATVDCAIKAGEQRVFYYRLAEDDSLYLNYTHQKGEALGLVEVKVWKGESLLQKADLKDFKETLAIEHKGIYAITLANASKADIAGKLQISRRPAYEESVKFDVRVPLKVMTDTTFLYEKKKVFVKNDTTAEEVMNRTFMVSSMVNLRQTSRTNVEFKLPAETAFWAYHLSVSEETNVQFDKLTSQLGKGAATLLASSNPLTAFALGTVSVLPSVSVGEDVDYYILPKDQTQAFMEDKPFKSFKKGLRVVTDYARLMPDEVPNKGQMAFGFYNDNFVEGVKATLRIVAIKVKPRYEWRTYRKPIIAKRSEPSVTE